MHADFGFRAKAAFIGDESVKEHAGHMVGGRQLGEWRAGRIEDEDEL